MSFHVSQRVRNSSQEKSGSWLMDRPDDSPPRSLREARRTSIPMSIPPSMQAENHTISSQQQPSSSTTTLPPFPRKRSSPLATTGVQPQHVSASIPQPLSSGHAQQYHPHMDEPQNFISSNNANQRRPTPPPGLYPRVIQRVPPPALVESDNRYNSIHDEWSISDQYLDSDHNHSQDPLATGLNLGSSLISNTSSGVPMPKGPIIEREREREGRSRGEQQKESPRDGDNIPSGGSTGAGSRQSDSLRRSTRPPLPQTQSFQTKNESPPPAHNQPIQASIQSQRPSVYSDRSSQSVSRSSPTYSSAGGVGSNSQVDSQHYAQPQQPSPTHKRDHSPQFRFEERSQPTKAKTPDRSLPVQEENEGEEDDTIKPPTDRERARDRERQRELDSETIKPRTLGHRLPTPQFSNSPMMPGDRIQTNTTSSPSEDLSTTIRDDDYQHVYDDGRNGRNSRAGHRYEEDEEEDHDHHEHGTGPAHVNESSLAQPDIEEQEDTETYTPRSPPANLPQTIPHLQHTNNNHINSITNNGVNANNNVHAERIMYHNNPSLSHFHFRPRTASSDAGGMPNLDAAVLQNPLASEYNRARGMAFEGSSFSQSHPFGAHTSPPQRVPTIDEIRALADGALHRQTMRPGAPIPPTPPNNGTYPTLAYLQPSISPPPPRATPYPFGYPYQHIMQQSPDPQQMLQHLLGMQTDSTFSPSSTPYPTYDYNPFLPEHFRRHDPTMSMRSSPSHMPVNLPFFPLNARSNQKKKRLKRTQSHRDLAGTLPPRGESTEPRETTPEPLDDDDEDIDEEYHDTLSPHEGGMSSDNVSTERGVVTKKDDNGNVIHNEDEDEADWIDEDDEEDESGLDLVHYESLPIYHPNPEKRRRRWEARWNELVKAFQSFDRETNSSMILMAAPTNSKTFYSIRSRSLRRNPSPAKNAEMRRLRTTFRGLATTKSHPFRNQPSHMSLVERFEHYSSSSSDTIETREEELKNTLGAALSTINALTNIYEGRDQRWVNEMSMRRDERERVDILLKQAFGFGIGGI